MKLNKEKKLLELIPAEADIVRAIYAMYLSGQTSSQITAYLYKKAYKTRTGRRFGSKLVCDILKNKLYTGKLVWNRRHYSKTEKTQHGLGAGQRYLEGNPSDIVESQGRHQPIITDEDYKRVQLRLGGNRKGVHRVFNKYEHILTGILKCAACGHSLFGHTNISNHRLKIRKKWYRCSLKAQTRSAECQEPNAVAEPLESFAFGILHKIASHSSIKEKRYNNLKKITTEPDDEILEQTQTAKKVLKGNREKQSKLSETYLNGDIGKEVYNDRQEPLRREEEKLLKTLDSLELKLIEKEQSKEYNNLLQTVLENFSETRENLTISEKKALLRLVFKEIIIKDGKLAGYELFEPFKTLLEEVQIEWQLKEIQGLTAKTEPVCTYARSVVRWPRYRGTMEKIVEALIELG